MAAWSMTVLIYFFFYRTNPGITLADTADYVSSWIQNISYKFAHVNFIVYVFMFKINI